MAHGSHQDADKFRLQPENVAVHIRSVKIGRTRKVISFERHVLIWLIFILK